ncbi:MAG: RluA family pseudouridine synthase [Pseudomonadota bacterium]
MTRHSDPGPTAPAPYDPPVGPVRVLRRDAALLVVEKPAGLLSVPGKGADLADCLLSRLLAEDPAVRLVHRLDRDTSGLMVFARSPKAQRHLGLQFERRHVRKGYAARVAGTVRGDHGLIDVPLAADWPRRPRQRVDWVGGRRALTHWQVLERGPEWTEMTLVPETGRSHQLRLHMRLLGHPILGDPLYGDAARAARLMLHANALALRHPEDGRVVRFASPAPWC